MRLGWLVVLASAPDIDYVVPALGSPAHQGSGVTHSVAFSLPLPLSSVGVLYFVKGLESRQRRLTSMCAVLAGLSHLVLEFSGRRDAAAVALAARLGGFLFPLGRMPTAGRLQLSNYYLHGNLLVELGTLAPLCYVAMALYLGGSGTQNRARMLILLLVAGCFVAWSLSLSR